MGEVYRATDTRLGREVALKLLPKALAADPERLARFDREARLLASLNHPGIAQLYGFETMTLDDGTTVHLIAMELAPGEDLAERLKRGPIPLDEATAIAKQIAEALEEAHEKGIVHRDLKPANVMLTPDGKVKVLDFGLAKAWTGDGGGASSTGDLSHSPTMTRATEAGMILGTAAYMSPEQARGKAVDKRTDIWAFGVVLYEILTARRAFTGGDVTEVLAAVIRDAPDLSALPAETPEPIRRLLRRCLEKDRHQRLADMGTVRLEIRDALLGAPETKAREAASAPRKPPFFGLTRVSTGLALLSSALAFALAVSLAKRTATRMADPVVIRFPLISDPRIRLATGITQPLAISPDGSTIVFSGSATGRIHLWARTLEEPEPRVIADTEGGAQPAISPDGHWVAFVSANRVIRKVRIEGGGATTVASLDGVTAAIAWGTEDDILFELIGSTSGIHRVSANGGTPELLIPIDEAANEVRQRRPFVLRDENRVLYASQDKGGGVTLGVFAPDNGRRAHLPVQGIQALGVVDGLLMYSRADGALMAVPFDAAAMQVRGPARQLTDRVAASGVGTAVTMSPEGTLVYQPAGAQASRLMLSDTAGRTTPLGNLVRAFGEARFSPDGRRVAVGIARGEEGEGLWVIDRTTAEATRVGGADEARLVDWTPDGKALLTLRGGEIWTTPVDGSQAASALLRGEGSIQAAALSPDGRSVVVARRRGGSATQELVRLSLDPGQAVVTIVTSRSAGGSIAPDHPRISHDGNWVAFLDQSTYEVHVRSIWGAGSIQVSDDGAGYGVWGSRPGQLFYGKWDALVEAELQTTPALAVKKRQRLDSGPSLASVLDIAPDGTLLVTQPTTEKPQVIVALNWGAGVRRQLQEREN